MASSTYRRIRLARWVPALLLCVCVLPGCRRGVPVLDTSPRPATPNGTISGIVSGPQGATPIPGRVVEVINVDTGERLQESTSSTGGFTFTLKPGRYRVDLTLRDGESLAKGPGVIDLNNSDSDAHANFVLGAARTSHRIPAGSTNSALGPPIA